MLTQILLAAILAQDAGRLSAPDFFEPADRLDRAATLAGALESEFEAETAADQVLATPAGQTLILSTLLCEAQQTQDDLADLLARGGERAYVARQMRIAAHREQRARLGLSMGLQPLACDDAHVEKLLQCLSIYAPAECATDAALAAQVRASERLAVQP
jgi:hypothetical protein